MSASQSAAGRQRKESVTPERRACDACFKLKEKCVFSEDYEDCQRCRRLSKRCTSERPIRPSGRPRKERNLRVRLDSSTLRSLSQGLPLELTPFGVLAKDLKPVEEFMFRMFLDSSNFDQLMTAPRVGQIRALHPFGPSDEDLARIPGCPQHLGSLRHVLIPPFWYTQAMHREAMISLLYNFDDMNDGYFSMFGSFAMAMGFQVPGFEPEVNTRRGGKALKKFCEMKPPTDRADFYPWMWLGTALTIHTHCVLGTNGAPIRRYILNHILRLAEGGLDLRSHPAILITISLDTMDSLLRREMPVSSYPHVATNELEDETLGLCAQLVDFVYDICKVSHAMARNGESQEHLDQISDIQVRLENFTATVTPTMATEMTAMEMAHMYAQVRIHKNSYLLVIHRLRFPFGKEDEMGRLLAQNIKTDLAMSTSISGSPPSWVTLPYLTAAIEMTGTEEREKAIEDVDLYIDGINPVARSSARQWLKAVWKMRDKGPGFKWLDVMDKLPPICINHVGSIRDIPSYGRPASPHNVSSVTVRSVPFIGGINEPEQSEAELPAGCEPQ